MGCEPELLKKEAMPAAAQKLDLPEGVPPLTSLYLYIAGSCNLACRHCWIEPDYQADNKQGKFLKLEHLKKAITEAKPLGLQSVKLTGGEPMLHPQFRAIIDYIEAENIGMMMETNGTLIDDEMALFLKSKPHFNFISVSVDGANADTHDNLRGVNGSFKRAIAGIKALVKAGFRPQLICTLHKGNVAELESVIELAETLGCGSVKFNHVQSMGRGDDFNENQILSVPEIISVFNEIEKIIKPRHNISVFFEIPMAFYPIKKLLRDPLSHCMIHNILGIISSGEMALCGIGTTIHDLIFGHLDTNSIKHIWEKNNKLIELRQVIPLEFEGICRECVHRNLCLGSCVANNFHGSSKLNAPFYFCQQADEKNLFPASRKQDLKTKGAKI